MAPAVNVQCDIESLPSRVTAVAMGAPRGRLQDECRGG